MTRQKRPVISLIIAGCAMVGVGVMVWKLPPNLWTESLVIGLVVIGSLLLVSWITGKTKYGVVVTLALVGMLVMRRLEILNWVTVGLGLVVLGLISLIG